MIAVPGFLTMLSYSPAIDVLYIQTETLSLLKVCSWISSRHLEITGTEKNPCLR